LNFIDHHHVRLGFGLLYVQAKLLFHCGEDVRRRICIGVREAVHPDSPRAEAFPDQV
jgi:hypothetical protein